MHRLSHRWLVRSAGVGTGVLLLALIAPGTQALAAVDPPAIAFNGGTLAPVACTSKPDTPNLSVATGSRVVLANFTGADAMLKADGHPPVPVSDGAAISVRFKIGVHSVQMVPDCLTNIDVEAATVTVVAGGVPDSTPSPSPGSAGGPAGGTAAPVPTEEPPRRPAVVTSAPRPSGAAAAVPHTTPAAAASPARGGRTPAAVSAVGGPVPDDDLEVTEVAVVRPLDGRGDRLLAVIALICAFGVTTAIIRAIVVQRARGAIGP